LDGEGHSSFSTFESYPSTTTCETRGKADFVVRVKGPLLLLLEKVTAKFGRACGNYTDESYRSRRDLLIPDAQKMPKNFFQAFFCFITGRFVFSYFLAG